MKKILNYRVLKNSTEKKAPIYINYFYFIKNNIYNNLMTSLDTNVSNYTLSELLTIVELDNDEDINEDSVLTNTNKLINRFKYKNPKLAVFFKEIQSQLLEYVSGLEPESDEDTTGKIVVEGFGSMTNDAIYPEGEKMISNWYENENLTQSDKNQTDKITNRQQKIGVFGNQHAPMKQEQIATTDTFSLPVKQDSLNPNLKNTINRFVNLDSQFRQYTSGIDSTSTDYTLDLSDTLKNALNLRLYSYQIPFSWYAIDTAYGNTCFWLFDSSTNIVTPISVPSGNYTQTAFVSQLNKSFQNAGILTPAVGSPYDLSSNNPVYYNPNSGKITMFLYDGSYNDPNPPYTTYKITSTTQIIFYDFTGALQCEIKCKSNTNHYFNNTLGWIMGYKLPYISIEPSGNSASSILDLNGTKYLILVIDDYNQNHVNNSLVSIAQYSNTLKIPSYYSPDIPYTCLTPAQQGNNLQQIVDGVVLDSVLNDQPINGLLIAGKYQQDYTSTQIALPSAPRTLTNAQLYTINSINSNNNNLTNYLAKAPTSSDILAIIPVKTSVGVPTGSLLVEFSGSLQDSSRTYFGPVNIERMAVKLLDDKGNVLNLNGNDWCVTLVCECLYQY
jgi:hypothetical protein